MLEYFFNWTEIDTSLNRKNTWTIREEGTEMVKQPF